MDCRQIACLTFSVAASLSTAGSAIAAKAPDTSWGRAGVTLAEYRSDAISCGRLGANADIADRPSTKAFVAAERWSDRNLNMPDATRDPVREQAQMIQRLNPAKRIAEVQGVHVSTMEACLKRLGYSKFVLTAAQARALRRLRPGSADRHAYLHKLASDPTILQAQQVGASRQTE